VHAGSFLAAHMTDGLEPLVGYYVDYRFGGARLQRLFGWEIAIGLHHSSDKLKFTFMNDEIIDRNLSKANGIIDLKASIHSISASTIGWSLRPIVSFPHSHAIRNLN